LLGSSFPSLRPPFTTSKTSSTFAESNSSSQPAHTQPPFPLPTLTGAMAEDDGTQQSRAACRVAQGTLAWLTGGVEGEEQGYLVGHAAFPSRSFPDVLGALAKRPGSGTWKEDKQVRHAGAGVVYHGEDEQEMWSWGVLHCTAPRSLFTHRHLHHLSLPKKELEHHLPAGLEVVGVYSESFERAVALHKDLGLPLPGLLAACTGGAVTLQDTQVGTSEGFCIKWEENQNDNCEMRHNHLTFVCISTSTPTRETP